MSPRTISRWPASRELSSYPWWRAVSRAGTRSTPCSVWGLVLKGETTHDRHVADAAAHGILKASLETDTPVLFGVLTCQTLEQARARALPMEQGGREDKGREVSTSSTPAC